MKAASVVRYASLPDASKKLGVQSGNQSPLLALFWLASQNTAVDLPDVANAFQPVQTVVPPSSTDKYIAPPNQTYMNALLTLQGSLDRPGAADHQTTPPRPTTLNNASAAHVAAKQVAQAFRTDPDAHMDACTLKLMEDPITYVEDLLRSLGAGDAQRQRARFLRPLSRHVQQVPVQSERPNRKPPGRRQRDLQEARWRALEVL